jgi:alkylation response protein AidB-like acyl-CoA dehydrogenase
MVWKLSEEQGIYQSTIRDWLADVAPVETVRRWLDAGEETVFEERFAGDGWAGVGLPEDIGGQGGGLVELALTGEELARAAAPSGAWLATALAVPALAGRGDLVGAALAGQTVTLLTPAEAMPDSAISLAIAPDGTVTGMVARVLAADRARRFIVPVGQGAERELRLVEADAAGVNVTRRALLDRSRSVGDVSLDGVPSQGLDVDAGPALCEVGARAAVLVAADTLGASQRMLDLAVDYSKQRYQFGRPIGSFQAVKHAAATMLVGIEAARSAVYFAAASVDGHDEQALLHAGAIKAQVTAEGARAADSALTMHGAVGYTWEHDLHLFYKRAKLDEPLFGTPGQWNERIADGLALV